MLYLAFVMGIRCYDMDLDKPGSLYVENNMFMVLYHFRHYLLCQINVRSIPSTYISISCQRSNFKTYYFASFYQRGHPSTIQAVAISISTPKTMSLYCMNTHLLAIELGKLMSSIVVCHDWSVQVEVDMVNLNFSRRIVKRNQEILLTQVYVTKGYSFTNILTTIRSGKK